MGSAASAGAAASALNLSAASTKAGPQGTPEVTPAYRDHGFEFLEWDVSRMAQAMQAGKLSSERLTHAYLKRIEATNHRGPRLRALIETNPEALAIAKTRDRERKEGKVRGLLHGIPVLLKDNIDTADQTRTTAGSLALQESTPLADAYIAARLRAAGAVLLGKTNMSEWANFRSWSSSSGWSARGGQARNPYVLGRSPIGSSSGSASSVAANLTALAIGTETNGSIVMPAAACSVVGFKPTVGWLSRRGIVPISASQDTAGPIARTVRDAALLFSVIAGRDENDPACAKAPERLQDPLGKLRQGALKGIRLGVARPLFPGSEQVQALMDDAMNQLKSQGATLIDVPDLEDHGFGGATTDVLLYEFKDGLNRYLATRGPDLASRTLADLIAFNDRHREKELRYFGQHLFVRAQEKGPLTEPAYLKAIETCQRLSRQEGIDKAMDTRGLDALVTPTAGPPWPIDLVNGDHFTGGCSTLPAVAGYPHITLPLGYTQHLPIGISFFGRAWSDAELLGYAYDFEQLRAARRPPRFLIENEG